YAKLIPKNQEAEYFGFFNMLGKFSAVLGPFLMGWVSLSTGNPRYSIFVVIIFFVIGGCFLMAHLQKQNKRLPPNSQI
ncbi:MAG: MFS transporter, partial [Bdellovibrionales bacterium]|nr:MFS transporter [Bdellovibrionales bacterium]